MKHVTFHRLKIKNFLSIGEDEVIIDFKKGIHIITGINKDKLDRRNGVGKSTIADALYFAIFGTTIREIKKEFVTNNLTNGVCHVELHFNVNSPRGNNEFVIKRSLNPAKLYIYKDGVDKTQGSILNTTEYIAAVLSSSEDIFHNCVIMTVNGTLPFMSRTKGDKRKFIEQIFNLQIFSDMLQNLRDDLNSVSKNFDIESAKQSEIEKSLQAYEQQKLLKVKEQDDKIKNINTKIQNNALEESKLRKELASLKNIDITALETKLETLDKAYTNMDKVIQDQIVEVTEINSLIKQTNEKISKVGTSNDICPTCLRPIELHDRKHFENEKKKLQTLVTEKTEKLQTCKSSTISNNDKKNKIKEYISNINKELNTAKVKLENKKNIDKRIQDLIDLNEQLKDSIANINSQSDTFNNLITEAQERLDSVKAEIDNIKKIINLLDVVKFVVSEEGVKSYIVKKILQNFNSKLAYYLKKLDSNSICVFNEYFEEEILNEKGKICSYNNFSGAERKAIDLACLFSFMDMRKAQGNVHYNISFYDELFDSSLDEKGIEIVLEILKERSEKFNESIFVISHRKESIKLATGDIIFLEKQNGITRRAKYVE